MDTQKNRWGLTKKEEMNTLLSSLSFLPSSPLSLPSAM